MPRDRRPRPRSTRAEVAAHIRADSPVDTVRKSAFAHCTQFLDGSLELNIACKVEPQTANSGRGDRSVVYRKCDRPRGALSRLAASPFGRQAAIDCCAVSFPKAKTS